MNNLRKYITGVDTIVPTISGQAPYINLDNGASTPPFTAVLQTVQNASVWYSSVHRGNGFKSRLSTATYEQSRQQVATFVGANASEHIVLFGKNTTEAINKLSYRLPLRKTDIVLVSDLEHHSNDLPWRARATVKRIRVSSDGAIERADYQRLLAKYGQRIKLVAISGASNVTGHMPNIYWFARKAHEVGAYILIDAAQLAAHQSIDMGTLSRPDHLDYVTISAHKMYAPYGTGALIGRRDTFERAAPEYSGGGTINVVTRTSVDWAPPPDRDEAGSPNVIGVIALAKATKMLQTIGLESIRQHEQALTAYALKQLKQVPGITIYGDLKQRTISKRSGVIPFTLANKPPQLVAAILGYEWGIGVRAGCFCAQPYVAKLLGVAQGKMRRDILRGRRDLAPGMVRISFGLYNTTKDIDKLITALVSITNNKHAAYTVNSTTGYYAPLHTHDDFTAYFRI